MSTANASDRPEILLVSSNFPPVIGGSAVVYDQLCRALAPRVLALGSSRRPDTGEPWPDLAALDAALPYPIRRVDQLRPPIAAAPKGRLSRLAGLVSQDLRIMAKALMPIVALVLRHRIKTVVIGELVTGGWLVYPLRFLLGCRVIIYTHGEEVLQDIASLQGWLRRRYLRDATAIVSVSLFCRGTIVSKYGVRPERIFVVPNGVDLTLFNPGPRDRAVLPEPLRDRRIILSVSRLVARKGQAMLIRALPRILERVPDAHCVIVGTGPELAHLHDETERLGLDDRVSFLGAVSSDDLPRLYRAADLFVLPCRTLPDGDTEGFGLVFLEANACGLPVVAGAAGGTVEAVIDGETGMLVDGNDIDDIAAATLTLLADPERARRYAEAGCQRAQQSSWVQVARDFAAICAGTRRIRRAVIPAEPAALPAPSVAGRTAPKLLLTVDVEEQFDWTVFTRQSFAVDGLRELQEFHAGCAELGLSPVLLCTYPLLVDPDFGRFFRRVQDEGTAEIGIHPHGWTTPPLWEHVSVYNSYQSNLPRHVERRKLERLCRTYEDRIGQAPRIHRAGRWGGGPQTFELIEDLGIEVDLSLSRGLRDSATGGPDYRDLDGRPVWLGTRRRVLSIPASSVDYLRGPDWVTTAVRNQSRRFPNLSALARDLLRNSSPVRFSPEGVTDAFLQDMARRLADDDLPVAVCTLHGTSLYGGGSPYARDADEARAMRARALSGIDYCLNRLGFSASSCADLLADARAARTAGVRAAAPVAVALQPQPT